MQIHRFDNAGSAQPTPLGVRTGAGISGSRTSADGTRTSEAGGSVNGSELDALIGQLANISDVRAEVVAEAKVKVQRGDYLTRAAAEETAAALLSKDA
ncbi:MAG: hypothetical protein KDA96_12985 [Planctomycetaceae bacterium]|nr:hypothetical protein [Planctomycetaceae bacterium]